MTDKLEQLAKNYSKENSPCCFGDYCNGPEEHTPFVEACFIAEPTLASVVIIFFWGMGILICGAFEELFKKIGVL